MKVSRQMIENARQAYRLEQSLEGVDIYCGNLRQLCGMYWRELLVTIRGAGLLDVELAVVEQYIKLGSIHDVAKVTHLPSVRMVLESAECKIEKLVEDRPQVALMVRPKEKILD